jgi:phosphonate transport system substrate-binding protein
MVDILSKELGIPVEFSFATNYSTVIEAMIAGNVDMAQFGPFSYVIATGNGAKLTPVGIATKEGKDPSYRAYGITSAKNTSVTSLKDFKGKTTCFVDPASTSGYLYPSAGLLAVGLNPETDVKPTFAGGHDAAAISVANGTCEVGFAFDTMLTSQLITKGDLKGVVDTVEKESINPEKAELKIVWKSPAIPNSPIAMQSSLPPSLQSEIKRIITTKINVDSYVKNGICATKEKCSIGDEDASSYTAIEDSLYDGVRKVCELTKSAKCKLT